MIHLFLVLVFIILLPYKHVRCSSNSRYFVVTNIDAPLEMNSFVTHCRFYIRYKQAEIYKVINHKGRRRSIRKRASIIIETLMEFVSELISNILYLVKKLDFYFQNRFLQDPLYNIKKFIINYIYDLSSVLDANVNGDLFRIDKKINMFANVDVEKMLISICNHLIRSLPSKNYNKYIANYIIFFNERRCEISEFYKNINNVIFIHDKIDLYYEPYFISNKSLEKIENEIMYEKDLKVYIYTLYDPSEIIRLLKIFKFSKHINKAIDNFVVLEDYLSHYLLNIDRSVDAFFFNLRDFKIRMNQKYNFCVVFKHYTVNTRDFDYLLKKSIKRSYNPGKYFIMNKSLNIKIAKILHANQKIHFNITQRMENYDKIHKANDF